MPLKKLMLSLAWESWPFERYGKGQHSKARLNMGDSFAYACARVHKATLLCKGDDFIHTDIELA
jgi:ribonuclease VapC